MKTTQRHTPTPVEILLAWQAFECDCMDEVPQEEAWVVSLRGMSCGPAFTPTAYAFKLHADAVRRLGRITWSHKGIQDFNNIAENRGAVVPDLASRLVVTISLEMVPSSLVEGRQE